MTVVLVISVLVHVDLQILDITTKVYNNLIIVMGSDIFYFPCIKDEWDICLKYRSGEKVVPKPIGNKRLINIKNISSLCRITHSTASLSWISFIVTLYPTKQCHWLCPEAQSHFEFEFQRSYSLILNDFIVSSFPPYCMAFENTLKTIFWFSESL